MSYPPQPTPSNLSEKKVLIILSSSSHITVLNPDSTTKTAETGYFLKELAQPLSLLLDTGYTPVFANPEGSKPHMDPLSDSTVWYLGSRHGLDHDKSLLATTAGFQTPHKFSDISDSDLESFKGVFVPGGHAPMTDLASNAELGRILKHFHERQKPTAVICHGPVALLSARDEEGRCVYRGYKVACYSKVEELANELMWGGRLRKCGDLLEEEGVRVETGWVPLGEKVVGDREVVSGENPGSAGELGRRFVGMLEGRA